MNSILRTLAGIGLAAVALAQCPIQDAQPPTVVKSYPLASDRYSVQYSVAGGAFTDAKVYISYYGGTLASPLRPESGYVALQESMSFTNITVNPNTPIQFRVTKLFGSPFQANDQVSVRPGAKKINAVLEPAGTVLISRTTSREFAGEQFLLWWNRGGDGGGVESLVFFLNPPYARPSGSNVKVVAAPADLTGDLSAYDTLDFEGTVAIGSTGSVAFSVPANILNIFLGPDAWVKGKFRFPSTIGNTTRRIYGPGVLDVSQFDYEKRLCSGQSAFPDQGYYALTGVNASGGNPFLNNFAVDGIAILDHNHAANDTFLNSLINNVKTLGWNGENAALRLGNFTTASNLFIRSGDDSLMDWGESVTITNATVWQNFNGGVVNLGWANNTRADHSLLDGLYVVKTDWHLPTNPSWTQLSATSKAPPLQDQNNAVFASLMTPGTQFGAVAPPIYRNIFVDDPPQVLFSLKILPPICGQTANNCLPATLTDTSTVTLAIENLTTPVSAVQNLIGFQTLPAGYTQDNQTFSSAYTFTGSMNIGLNNVVLTASNGSAAALTSANAASLGKLTTNGASVNLTYGTANGASPEITLVANAADEQPFIAPNTWVEVKGRNLAPAGDTRIWGDSDFSNNKMPTVLDGVSVTVNGKPTFVYYISPTQINILTPPDALPGLAQIVVSNKGVASNPVNVQTQAISPSFFLFGSGPYAAATHANGTLIGPASLYPGSSTPAKPGETILFYTNGFGPTSSPIASGSITQSGNLAPLPVIKIGGVGATVAFAGLVSPGEFQFNVIVPTSLADGDQPVTATYDGLGTQPGTAITVQK
jgi:uncharacterized protein (TIGR03437 family)